MIMIYTQVRQIIHKYINIKFIFTYAVIMATHIRFRKRNGCPQDGKCQIILEAIVRAKFETIEELLQSLF